MKKNVVSILKKSKQYIAVLAAIFLVLLSSCAVKGGIKSFMLFPDSIQNTTAKSMQFMLTTGIKKCAVIENAIASSSQELVGNHLNFLPLLLLSAALLILSGVSLYQIPPHPRYGTLKISGSLPIFLQYQKLII